MGAGTSSVWRSMQHSPVSTAEDPLRCTPCKGHGKPSLFPTYSVHEELVQATPLLSDLCCMVEQYLEFGGRCDNTLLTIAFLDTDKADAPHGCDGECVCVDTKERNRCSIRRAILDGIAQEEADGTGKGILPLEAIHSRRAVAAVRDRIGFDASAFLTLSRSFFFAKYSPIDARALALGKDIGPLDGEVASREDETNISCPLVATKEPKLSVLRIKSSSIPFERTHSRRSANNEPHHVLSNCDAQRSVWCTGQFLFPKSVACLAVNPREIDGFSRPDEVFVSSRDRIFVLSTLSGSIVRAFGAAHLKAPRGIAVSSRWGLVFVAHAQPFVAVFRVCGDFVCSLPASSTVRSLALCDSTDELFVPHQAGGVAHTTEDSTPLFLKRQHEHERLCNHHYITVHRVSDRERLRSFDLDDPPGDLVVSSDGSVLAVAHGQRGVAVYCTSQGTLLASFFPEFCLMERYPDMCLALSPDNRTLFVGGASWDAVLRYQVEVTVGSGGRHPPEGDSSQRAKGAPDETLRFRYSAALGSCNYAPGDGVRGLCMNSFGQLVVASTYHQQIRLYS